MTAGRVALGPIGIAASLFTLPIGAAIAGSKERNYIKRSEEAERKMEKLESILEKCRSKLMPLQPRMAVISADLQRHTSQLETASTGTPVAQETVERLDMDMRKATAVKNEIVGIIGERDEALKMDGFASGA